MFNPLDLMIGTGPEWRDLTFMQRVHRRVVGVAVVSLIVLLIFFAPIWGVLIGSIFGDIGAFIGGALGIGVWIYAGAMLVEFTG